MKSSKIAIYFSLISADVLQRRAIGNALFLSKRIGNPAHTALRIYQHNVEAYTSPPPVWVVREHGGTSGKQAGTLPLADGGCGQGKLGARLHLHQRQQTIPLGSDIDLAGCRTQPPPQHRPTLSDQGGAGGGLRGDATRMRLPATQLSSCPKYGPFTRVL